MGDVRADKLKAGDVIINAEDRYEETILRIVINEEANKYERYEIYVRTEAGDEPILVSSDGATYEVKE